MSDNPFFKLAPFIQEYIYTHGWTDLRPVQLEACRVLFDTDAHLLLATGTASGKTEAAFLPILTLLYEEPARTIGALYIGPTKALINDQFFRLEGLLQEADLPVWHWHGDVSQSHKKKLLKQPYGVLQITPESLESLLINRPTELVNLLGDLRFIVIDEVHVFMGSDRGRQILCQLKRLERFIASPARRVGLSATLGDPTLAEAWLKSGTNRPVATVNSDSSPRLRLGLEHFYIPDSKETKPSKDDTNDDPYYRFIYEHSRARKKCLIFTNRRSETESVIANLRQIAQREQESDIYHVHHGSISAPLREAAEQSMRDPDVPAITAATVTLELGIDLGQLERVIQLGAPFSVSSFLQRLGRSGRRGAPSEMLLVCSEEEPSPKELIPDQIPWTLLQCIAIIQLYVEEQWLEPIPPIKYPFSLLYHQTMSTLASTGELSPASLAQRVLTLPPFSDISPDNYRELLRHLITIDHIEPTETGTLIIGLAGERIVRNFRFYAVFPDNEEFAVKAESREIGSIITPPPPGERFGLAGRTWEVLEIDLKRKTVFVRRVKGKAKVNWSGGGGDIHTRILARMRQALLEDKEIYRYLQQGAISRLQEARQLARQSGLERSNILPLGGDSYCIFPWVGSVGCRTLERYLHTCCQNSLGINTVTGLPPYYLRIRTSKSGSKEIAQEIAALSRRNITEDDLIKDEEAPQLQKYDDFVPNHLLRKAFAADYLNVRELVQEVIYWIG